ncbi:hypothetical protein ACSAZL_10320 [Methanosarcina sp. T3]|uniref:hypothetical protein n=1 Tax=Methanosarcina sp. T3 TaxID=3439062 RepID=UPI003F872B89
MSKYPIFLILFLIIVSGAGCITPENDNNTTPSTPPVQNVTVFTAEEVTQEQFNNTNFSEEGKFVYYKGEEEGFVKNTTIETRYLKGKVPIESLPIIIRTSDGYEEVEINPVRDNPDYPGSSQLNKIVEGAVHTNGEQPTHEEVSITFENNNYDVTGAAGPFNVPGDEKFRKEILSKGDVSYLSVNMTFYYKEFA